MKKALFSFALFFVSVAPALAQNSPEPQPLPIGGGIGFLIAGGIGYGIKKAIDYRKQAA